MTNCVGGAHSLCESHLGVDFILHSAGAKLQSTKKNKKEREHKINRRIN